MCKLGRVSRWVYWLSAFAAVAVVEACAATSGSRPAWPENLGEPPEPCPNDSAVYTGADKAIGVVPPTVLKVVLPEPHTVEGNVSVSLVVNQDGYPDRNSIRIERQSSDPRSEEAVVDAIRQHVFYPATRAGCAVRFYLSGITLTRGRPKPR